MESSLSQTPEATPEQAAQAAVQPQVNDSRTPVIDAKPGRRPFALLVVLVLLVVGAGAGGYVLGARQLPKTNRVISEPQPTVEPINQSTGIPTEASTAAVAQFDVPSDWPQYTISLGNLRFAFQSPYGQPKTKLARLQDYKSGDIFVIPAQENPFFEINKLKTCDTSEAESKTICIIPGKNWDQVDDIQSVLIDGNQAVSAYVFEPTSNSVLHVVQFTQVFPVQISAAVDGVGLEANFKLILNSFKFTE